MWLWHLRSPQALTHGNPAGAGPSIFSSLHCKLSGGRAERWRDAVGCLGMGKPISRVHGLREPMSDSHNPSAGGTNRSAEAGEDDNPGRCPRSVTFQWPEVRHFQWPLTLMLLGGRKRRSWGYGNPRSIRARPAPADTSLRRSRRVRYGAEGGADRPKGTDARGSRGRPQPLKLITRVAGSTFGGLVSARSHNSAVPASSRPPWSRSKRASKIDPQGLENKGSQLLSEPAAQMMGKLLFGQVPSNTMSA